MQGKGGAGREGAGASTLMGSHTPPADGRAAASAAHAAAPSEAAPEASTPEKGGQLHCGGRRSESASELESQSSATPRCETWTVFLQSLSFTRQNVIGIVTQLVPGGSFPGVVLR